MSEAVDNVVRFESTDESSWLTPMRCRLLLAGFVILSFGLNLVYLQHCPIDLAGDEAQYWDWSRHLDWSYYSKGPAIAYIIRASCAMFGDTAAAVRYPAVALTSGTTIVTYLFTRKLFGSDRLALGASLLLNALPIFVVGGFYMTIDAPMFFCWALATYFAAIAIFDDRQWSWVFVGFLIGLGFLAKYSELLWFIGLFGFLLTQRPRQLRGAAIALLIAVLCTFPVIVWNVQHGWVSLRHVARQTGASEGVFSLWDMVVFIGGQLAVVGPTMWIMMIAAIVYALRSRADEQNSNHSQLAFLLWIGLPFLALNFLDSFRAKVQLNWPAPAYFTLTILTAYFLGTRWRDYQQWKPNRGWFWITIAVAVIFTPIARDTSIIYPLLRPVAAFTKRDLGELDLLQRVRGWHQLGRNVSDQLLEMGPGTFILCDDYQQTAEMAFYVDGHLKTYCAGPYFGKRWSQYDMWQDRRLDAQSPLLSMNAIYIGKGDRLPPAVEASFERVEKQPSLDIEVAGAKIRSFKTWRCFGFKGMQRSNEPADY
ncbi:MAG TPA: glycosyltransferase family 39 protein [Tepidisphaeraceae bacterium]|nr:glycosyltransferase family 39 protein [Tepidisphaeraceae bacterium]